MKPRNYSNNSIALLAAMTLAALGSVAQAGPGPQQVFTPVKTMKQARALKMGTKIAFSCGNCGGVTMLTVDDSRSYLRGFTCPSCKRVYRVAPGGGGRAADQFVLLDQYGQMAHLATAGKL